MKPPVLSSITTLGVRTALVIVDMQNDFAAAAGSLYVRGGEALARPINALTASVCRAGGLVAASADWHPAHTPHFAPDGGVWPVHCVADTWGAAFAPGLRTDLFDAVIRKGSGGEDGYSAFGVRDAAGAETATPLHGTLSRRGATTVLVAGLATDYCVAATAIDAARLGYRVIWLADLSAAVDLAPGDGERAVARMTAAGVETAVSA